MCDRKIKIYKTKTFNEHLPHLHAPYIFVLFLPGERIIKKNLFAFYLFLPCQAFITSFSSRKFRLVVCVRVNVCIVCVCVFMCSMLKLF